MSKQSFEHLLEKYLLGKCTPAEKQLIEQWYELLGQEKPLDQMEAEWELVKARMWQKVNQQTTESPIVVRAWYTHWLIRSAVAACLVLAVGLIWWKQQPAPKELLYVVSADSHSWNNRSGSMKEIQLGDGSKVRLQPRAKMIAPKSFEGETREIQLEGDAFFEVAHNPQKPFIVHVGNVATKVLGTSFWIRTTPENQVEVAVRTGKVAVYESKKREAQQPNGVILTPNHKATYFPEEQHFVAGLVEKPQIIDANAVSASDFVFENASMSNVIKNLEKAYGIELFVENESLKNCTLTGNLEGLEMYEKLEVICQSLGATYQIQGTRIVLNGKGCL